MTVLRIFCDEAGTMPIDDTGDVFAAGTVASLVEVPTMSRLTTRQISWLVDQLRTLAAIPNVAFLRPRPGYGKAIYEKIQQMSTMARYTRLITEANRQYLTSDGIRVRNFVWIFCMGQSIVRTILSAIYRTEIHSVEIFLDEKTLPEQTRTLFQKQVSIMPNQLLESLREVRARDYRRIALYESRVQFSSESISACWSDEPGASSSGSGLMIAHYLASHYRRSLISGDESGIFRRLNEAGFENMEIDITNLIISPMNSQVIQAWQDNTGLKEPRTGRKTS